MTRYELTDEDADTAFLAIAASRYWSRCTCELDVGFVCNWCKQSTRRIARDNDEGHREDERTSEAIERYAATIKRKASKQ